MVSMVLGIISCDLGPKVKVKMRGLAMVCHRMQSSSYYCNHLDIRMSRLCTVITILYLYVLLCLSVFWFVFLTTTESRANICL